MTIKLVRKSRIDNQVIIYNDTEDMFSLINNDNIIIESSDDISSLTASASWRRPTRDEVSSYVYTNNREIHAPALKDKSVLQKMLETDKITTSALTASLPDLKRLYEWAESAYSPDDVEEEPDDLDDAWDYYAVSDIPYSPRVNDLYAADRDGDMFKWDGEFIPTDDTVEAFEAPTVVDVDPESAQALRQWLIMNKSEDDPYFDISEIDPEEKALFDAALREMDTYMLDTAASVLSSASKLWYDDHDKYLRQETQSRDWHGRYNGPQAPKERKLFFPKARIHGDVNYDMWGGIMSYVKDCMDEAASGIDNAMYIAIVDPVDTSAVLDLIAIIINETNGEPASWVRRNGEWVQDNIYLDTIRSATPPTTVVLDKDDVEDVVKQVDATDEEKAEGTASVEDHEEYICAALANNSPELIPAEWKKESRSSLFGKYGEVITAGGVPGIADTPEDFAATARLKKYWAFGKGTAKWLPGTPGDLTRLHNHLAKYVGPNRAWGLAQNIFKMHFGVDNNTYDKATS